MLFRESTYAFTAALLVQRSMLHVPEELLVRVPIEPLRGGSRRSQLTAHVEENPRQLDRRAGDDLAAPASTVYVPRRSSIVFQPPQVTLKLATVPK